MDKQSFRYGLALGGLVVAGAMIGLKALDDYVSVKGTEMSLPKVECPAENVPFYETPLYEKILEFKDGEVKEFEGFEDLYDKPLPMRDGGTFWA